MEIDQQLSIYIPKIPASIVKKGEENTYYIELYLKDKFSQYGIVNKIIFSLIDKKDKSKKFYSVILFFEKWFENSNVEIFQKSVIKRNEKIFYETNKFFYVYPQKKFKEEDFFIESKVLDNNLFKDSFTQTDNNNNLLKEQLSSIRTLHNKMNILQQDMNHYFNTIQNNMNFLSYNIENNIYTLRKEQNFYYNILSNYFPIYNGSVNLNNNINEESNIFAENYKLDKGDDLIEKLRSQYKL